MYTEGSVVVGGKRYYIAHDAYPRYAGKKFRMALKYARTPQEFIKLANQFAGGEWIKGLAPRDFGYPFEIYRWYVDLKNKRITYTITTKKNTGSEWRSWANSIRARLKPRATTKTTTKTKTTTRTTSKKGKTSKTTATKRKGARWVLWE